MSFNSIVWLWIASAITSFIYLLYKPAPYGRHVKKGWGPTLNNRLAWIMMEAPVFIIVLSYLAYNYHRIEAASLILMSLFLLHYFYRCFIYPFRLRPSKDKMPLTIVLSAVIFNLVNGNVLGYYFAGGNPYMIFDWTYVAGVLVFFIGMLINIVSDEKLIRLKLKSNQYAIPYDGLYNYVSCPNYFGEIIEWFGFALAGGHLAVWSFFIWTCANLIPRALSNHRWYINQFPEYNKKRKAVLPFLL